MIAVGAAVRPLGITGPVQLSGFAARTQPSEGEHDILTARALAFDEVLLITLDVCALEATTCRRIAEAAHPEAPSRVVVTATHTHAGPCSTPHRLTRCDAEIEDLLVMAAGRAGREARQDRRPATMSYRSARGAGIASNRRHADRPVDPPVHLVQFADADGVFASLLSFPCHPVVLDGTNRLLSGDYVHPLREDVEAESPGSMALFATGCAGDINTGHSAEASFSLTASGSRTFAEASRIGTAIARTVLAAEPEAEATPRPGPVVFAEIQVTAAFDRPGHEVMEADRRRWRSELAAADPGRAELLRIWLRWADQDSRDVEWSGRVSAFRIGDLTIVCLPGEPFLRSAEAIAAQVAGNCIVLGYSDDCPGYFPTVEEYAHGGYEVDDAHRYYGMPGPFRSGAAEHLVEGAVEACRALG